MATTAAREELTVRLAAQRVQRAEETVRRWIWSGRLPARKRGNVYVVLAADVDAAASGSVPGQRGAPARGLSEWLDDVATWRSRNGVARRESAADLVLDDRAERSRHAGR
ncbi:MAG: helix-turn-helix domain-containing protein [Actinomycetota bacterium]|nr:helix-turn-helix domain-containing protein [Actinomycetota bacterium]